jgi:eukaryotic-like serine/threonine-protein kinase
MLRGTGRGSYGSAAVSSQIIAGRYQVIREIGAGGMGAVCEAVHIHTGKRVAVKVVHNRHDDVDEKSWSDTLSRFSREARAASAIDTPHISRVFDAGTDEDTGQPYLVMELLEGFDLFKVAKKFGPLPPDTVIRIAIQACRGLERAHAVGVIHRDIKPGNIFLSESEDGTYTAKILDFGIAKLSKSSSLSSGETSELTRTGTMVGSPQYMSPEQAKSLKTIDARSDIWSLGVVIYRLLTGSTPFRDLESLGQLILAICTDPAPPLQERAPWVSARLAAIVHRALEIAPENRFQTAGEMRDALAALIQGEPIVHRDDLRMLDPDELSSVAARFDSEAPDPLTTQAPAPAGARVEGAAPLPPSPQPLAPQRTSRTLAVAVVTSLALALAAASAVAVITLRHDSPAVPSSAPSAVATATPSAPPMPSIPASPAPLTPRAVRLTVTPSTATVLVDDVPSTVSSGAVEIRGEPGSVHRVKVSAGAQSKSEEVVITETGARPDTIALVVPGGATKQATTSAKKGPSGPATSPPAKAPDKLGAATTME